VFLVLLESRKVVQAEAALKFLPQKGSGVICRFVPQNHLFSFVDEFHAKSTSQPLFVCLQL